jgi:hypothetical protein
MRCRSNRGRGCQHGTPGRLRKWHQQVAGTLRSTLGAVYVHDQGQGLAARSGIAADLGIVLGRHEHAIGDAGIHLQGAEADMADNARFLSEVGGTSATVKFEGGQVGDSWCWPLS